MIEDGTNRIGDLQFRLTELEGGDVGKLPKTPPLGGEVPLAAVPAAKKSTAPQLAVGEQADFDAAKKLAAQGSPADAFAALNQFVDTYPRSPLAAEAQLYRGDALVALGNTSQAGRAYLESYTTAEKKDPAVASQALYKLGTSLKSLGQTREHHHPGSGAGAFPRHRRRHRRGQGPAGHDLPVTPAAAVAAALAPLRDMGMARLGIAVGRRGFHGAARAGGGLGSGRRRDAGGRDCGSPPETRSCGRGGDGRRCRRAVSASNTTP